MKSHALLFDVGLLSSAALALGTNMPLSMAYPNADEPLVPPAHQERNLAQPSSGANCLNRDQSDYRGSISVTKSGLSCQRWAVQFPHIHTTTPQKYPDDGLASNYCRNPDNSPKAWCFTTNPFKRWEWCDIPTCSDELPAPEHSAEPTTQPTGSIVVEDETSDQPISGSPTMWPSAKPTDPSTLAPTVSPSGLPTVTPSKAPLTDSPSQQTTESEPTIAPTSKATSKPSSILESRSPTQSSIRPEEGVPSSPSPTPAVTTASESDSPTRQTVEPEPTISPSGKATTKSSSTLESRSPTQSPIPSEESVSSPLPIPVVTTPPSSAQPSDDTAEYPALSSFQEGVASMHLRGVSSIGADAEDSFVEIYEKHVLDFYKEKDILVDISINITKVHLPALLGRRRLGAGGRELATNGVKITFTQKSRLVSAEPLPEDSMDDFMKEPFEKYREREEFANDLRESNDEFSGLTSVSPVELPTAPEGTPNAGTATEQGRAAAPTSSNRVLVIVAVALAIIGTSCVLVAVFYFYVKRKERSVDTSSKSDTVHQNLGASPRNKSQLNISTRSEVDDAASSVAQSQWQLSVVDGEDGISTIVSNPTDMKHAYSLSQVSTCVDDQSTLTEEEFDYPNPYNQSSMLPPRPADDDDEFTILSQEGCLEKITIDAPPGRLGILIHAELRGGPPIVHSVKDSSPLLGQVLVNDRLVAVDEIDVTRMNAIQATEVIADRNQQRRRLHIVRNKM